MDTRTIGVIAADETGIAIAQRIAASGKHAILYLTAAAPRPAKMAGVEIASTPADVALGCDVIILAIDDTAELRRILLGTPDRLGVAAEMMPGGVLIDTGARPPRETQTLLGVTGMRAIAVVDAALIGSLDHSAEGSPLVLAGGYPDAVDLALPILKLLGRVERTGPLGSAHTAAALMGYMEAAHLVAREEAQSVGRALGLAPETLQHMFEGNRDAHNIIQMAQRTRLIRKLAHDRGVSAEVIDLTWRKLESAPAESG